MNQTNRECFDRRGRRVELYEYKGSSRIDSKKLVGTVGIVLYEEGNSTVIFCPAVNRVLTFANSKKEFSYIWNKEEKENLQKYQKKVK
jgi:hypothetical protein